MQRFNVVLLVAVAAGLAGACGGGTTSGGSGTGPTCSTFQDCGGDAIGRWNLQRYCGDLTVAVSDDPACQDSEVIVDTSGMSSTLSINDDGSYSVTFTGTGQGTLGFTEACAQAMVGAAVSLDQFCPLADTEVKREDPNASCTVVGSVCECTMQTTPENETGTYVVSGNEFTTTASTGGTTTFAYCVQGDTLKARDTSTLGDAYMLFAR